MARVASYSASNSSASLSFALTLVPLAACGGADNGPELRFDIDTSACTQSVFCTRSTLTRVDAFVIGTSLGGGQCLRVPKRIVPPEGEQALTGVALRPNDSVELVLLGYCGDRSSCSCGYRAVHAVVDGFATAVELTQTGCRSPPQLSDCDAADPTSQ